MASTGEPAPGSVLPNPLDTAAVGAATAELERAERYDDLYRMLRTLADLHPQAVAASRLAVRAAGVARSMLEDPRRMREALEVALVRDPSSAEALAGVAEMERNSESWEALASTLERLAAVVPDPFDRSEYLAQAGEIWQADAGRGEKALAAFRAALRAIPPQHAASADAVRVLSAPGRRERMETALRPALEGEAAARPGDARLALGRLLVSEVTRRAEAVELLHEAAVLDDASGMVGLAILGGLHALGEGWDDLVDLLISDAGQLVEDDPETALVFYREAADACLEEPRDLQRASGVLRRVLSIEPEDVPAAEALLGVYTSARRHREAVALLDDLGKVAAPTVAALYLVRAGVIELARFGNRAASLAFFERALARDPACASAATHLKEAYRDVGRWRDVARVMLKEVEHLELDDRVLDILREAGRILRDRAGDLVAAVDVYRRIVSQDATDPDAIEFFQAYHDRLDREGRVVDAHARAADAASSSTKRVEALTAAAEAAVRLGSPPRARSFFEAARREHPDDVALRNRYFQALSDWGDYERLLEALVAERTRVGPDHPEWVDMSLRAAEVAYRGLGRIEGALRLYEEVVSRGGPGAEAARVHVAALQRSIEEAGRYAGMYAEGYEPLAPAGSSDTEVTAPPPPTAGEVPAPAEEPESAEPPAPPTAESLLAEARALVGEERFEEGLEMATRAAALAPEGGELAAECHELAADILIDHLDDVEEGLDRFAVLGRDRSLPLSLRRRVNEARVRVLERDIAPDGARDRALAEALADAAAVAETSDRTRALQYRQARLLVGRRDSWRVGVDILQRLLPDDPENLALLDLLATTYEREEQWAPLLEVLQRRAELADDEPSVELYGRLADIAADGVDDPEAAMRYLRRALERVPGHRDTLVTLARLAAEAGDSVTRAEALRGWIAVESDHDAIPSLHYALGEALESQGLNEDAFSAYRRTLEGSPGSAAALAGLERTALAASDPADQVAALEICARFADDPEAIARIQTERARTYEMVLGDRTSAREALRAALAAQDGHLPALTLARQIAERGGEGATVVADLLRRELWASSDPGDAAVRYAELGALYAGPLADPQLALSYFQQSLEVRPGEPRALSGLARLHLEVSDPSEARPFLERLTESEDAPEAVRAWACAQLAEASESAGDYPEAMAAHARASQLDPDAPEPLVALGRLGVKLGDDRRAAEALEALAKLGEAGVSGAPVGAELTDVYSRAGSIHRRLGDRRAAIAAYRQAVLRDAVHRDSLRALAVLYEMEGEWLAAAEMRERAAELIPDRAMRATALAAVGGFLRDRVGDPRRALDAFHRAAALAPDEISFPAAVLALARKLGQMSEGRAAALDCVRLSDDPLAAAEYLAAAAECADGEGEPEEAIDLARAALERDPANARALERAVPALERGGDWQGAVELLQRAVSAARTREDALRWQLERARLYHDHGDGVAASEAYAAAAAIEPTDGALLAALSSGPPPPPAAAATALEAVAEPLRRRPVDVPRLLAVENLARGAGDADRAYLAAALLDLIRAAPTEVREHLAVARERRPEVPHQVLGDVHVERLVPPFVARGSECFRVAEAVLLSARPGDREVSWPPPEYRIADRAWQADVQSLAHVLGVEAPTLGVAAPGAGVRILPDQSALVVGDDLLTGRLPGEARATLAFGLGLAVPGRRWTTATGEVETAMARLFAWSAGRLGPEEADAMERRYGPEARGGLREVCDAEPSVADYLDGSVVLAARQALLMAGDLVQGLVALMRVLAPEAEVPRGPDALAAALGVHPALADAVGFVFDPAFSEARRGIGLAVVD